ncbi:hypothetical protein [Nitratifractor sp.]
MKKLFVSLLLLLLAAGAILFSSFGQQKILLPLANFALEIKVPQHRIVLTRLQPGFSSLHLEGTVDGGIRFMAEGPVHWWSRSYRMAYRIEGEKIEVEGRQLPVRMKIHGRIEGEKAKLKVAGKGEAFGAPLDYSFRFTHDEIEGLVLNVKGAQLAQILVLADLPTYADGRLDLRVDLPRLDPSSPSGQVHFSIAQGRLDRRLLAHGGITVPAKSSFTASGELKMERGLLKGEGALTTPFGRLDLTKFFSDGSLKIFKAQFRLHIKRLQDLEGVAGIPLQGEFASSGLVYYDRNKHLLQLQGSSTSLGGKSSYLYDGQTLTVKLEGLSLPTILRTFRQPPYLAKGRLDGHLVLNDLKVLRGRYELKAQGSWNGGLPGMKILATVPFRAESHGRLAHDEIDGASEYRSGLMTLKLEKSRYLLLTGSFESRYRLEIPELGKLSGGKFGGPFAMRGSLAYAGDKRRIRIDGKSPSFGGETRLLYEGKLAQLILDKLDPDRLLVRMGQPALFVKGGTLDAKAKIVDFAKRRGSFEYRLEGLMDRHKVRKLYGITLPEGFRISLGGKGALAGERLTSHSTLKSPIGTLALSKMLYRIDRGTLRSQYRLEIPDLSKLRPLIGRSFQGALAMTGLANYDGKSWHIDGQGRQWGGEYAWRLDEALLRAKVQKADIRALLETLEASALLQGTVAAKLRYDLARRTGNFEAHARGMQLTKSPLSQAAKLLLKFDLDREVFDRSTLKAKIVGDAVRFDFDARSPRLILTIHQGRFDRKRQRVDAVLVVQHAGKLYKLRIQGPIARPQVIPLMTRELQKKIGDQLNKHHLDKKIPNKLGPVKNLIEHLF